MRRILATVLFLALAPPAAAHGPTWHPVPTGSTQQFRGLDAVSKRVAWVGGSAGEVLRTTDGGRSWQDVSPPGSARLLFRDVEAQSAYRASVLAIGEGEASRIYTTFDGGRNWISAFVNDDPNAFYDCMAFYPGTGPDGAPRDSLTARGRRGLVLSDPVGGKFRIAATDDFGRSWHVLPNTGMPPAMTGEAAFAASGTCLVTSGRDAWFATGVGAARVFHSRDGGKSWDVTAAPIPPSAAGGGVFSLAFRNPRDGVMVGGDYTAPTSGARASGFTRDGGASWQPGGDLSGYRSGVDWVLGRLDAFDRSPAGRRQGPTLARATLIAVGPTGSDVSEDGGRSWRAFDATPFDAVDCVPFTCWASGPNGAVAVLGR